MIVTGMRAYPSPSPNTAMHSAEPTIRTRRSTRSTTATDNGSADRIAKERDGHVRQRRQDRKALRGKNQRHNCAEAVIADRLKNLKGRKHDRNASIPPVERVRKGTDCFFEGMWAEGARTEPLA